jgi:hypothetical protein
VGSGARAVAAPAKLDTKGEAMWSKSGNRLARWSIGLASLLVVGGARLVQPQGVAPQGTSASAPAKKQQTDTSIKIEIYGFTQGDMINDFKTNNPDWFDVNRPSKLPAFTDEFGHNGHTWLSARQSRFGTKATIPTSTKPITVVFDWDLFGVGVDAGQTTIRPRHMYGQWGVFGAGQTESPFMDLDVFPNILEYWGPNGMLFFRNVQFFYEPLNEPNGTRAIIALERPGASGDAGLLSDRVELQNIVARFPVPDISGTYRYAGNWGYAKIAGIVRWIRWDDVLTTDAFDLNGGVTGWGVSLSGGYKAGKKDLIHAQVVYGAGVENYFNDAPVDVGVRTNLDEPLTPVTGKALPDFGMVLYLDHTWNDHFTSAIGYSRVDIDNSNLQLPEAFKIGQYASTNLLWTPVKNVLIGGEFQWGYRQNHSDGFHFDDFRLQFSGKYSFSQTFGGKQ